VEFEPEFNKAGGKAFGSVKLMRRGGVPGGSQPVGQDARLDL